MVEETEADRTVWCGNLSDKVTDGLLFELFLQAAPLDKVRICRDKDGKSCYGFVTFKHAASVAYTVELFNGTSLFNRRINIKPRTCNLPKLNFTPYNKRVQYAPQEQIQPPVNMPDANGLLDFGLLTQMGQHLLLANKVPSNNYDNINMLPSTPMRHSDYMNNRDDRPYRRHHNRRNERYDSNKSYRGGRNYERY